MPTYKMLVTDVTNYGSLRCVAGWDIDRRKMIRPEPHAGGFWSAIMIGPTGFQRSKIVTFTAIPPNPATKYPHRTEDRVVVGAVTSVSTPSRDEVWKILRSTESEGLSEIFDSNLVYDGQKAYVPDNTQTRSQGAIALDPKEMEIEKHFNYVGKERLRARFTIEGRTLAPNLTSTAALAMLRNDKVEEINKRIAAAKRLHVRVGLARAFPGQPTRCYMQINGIILG